MKQFRTYRDSDAGAILAWPKDADAYYLWCAGKLGPWPVSEESLEFLHTMYAYVLEEDGRPLGLFTLRHPEDAPDAMRLGFVIVDPARRREGIASAMLEEGLRLAFDHYGAAKVNLLVFEQNTPAIAYYKAAGFRAVPGERVTFPAGDETWACRIMEVKREDWK